MSGNIGLGLSDEGGFVGNHCYSVGSTMGGLMTGGARVTGNVATGGSPWPTSPEKGNDSVGATGAGLPIGPKEMWDDEVEDLAELFGRLGLGKYTDLFQQQEVCNAGQI